jgi:hypothetical protein
MQREGVNFPISGFNTQISMPVAKSLSPSSADTGSDNTVIIIAVAASVGGVVVLCLIVGVLLYFRKKVSVCHKPLHYV